MPSEIVTSEERPEDVSCDAMIVGAFEGGGSAELSEVAIRLDAALDGNLREYLDRTRFRARPGDLVLMPAAHRIAPGIVAVLGLGAKDQATPATIRRAAGNGARRLSDLPVLASALHDDIQGDAANLALEASVEGLMLGGYKPPGVKSKPLVTATQRIIVLGAPAEAVEYAGILAEATMLARDLVNEPASSLTPDALSRRARQLSDAGGLECTIRDENDLERDGFGGILAVSQGSLQPPRLIEMAYRPEGSSAHVAIVGKGITFDSGGLSLKDAQPMEEMKTDMAGGAAVIAAMSVLARLNLPTAVTAFIPAAENMPDGGAVKPGDVITHYGGSTTEVLNTDAEGRLVLADVLALASEGRPAAIVDLATLTGSIRIALGRRLTGLFATEDEIARRLLAAGEEAGEPMWRMPLYEELRGELDSDMADIKNIGSRWGGAILAALFLREFVADGIPWAHLDIAGTARSESDRDEVCKGGTGTGARTLLRWMKALGR